MKQKETSQNTDMNASQGLTVDSIMEDAAKSQRDTRESINRTLTPSKGIFGWIDRQAMKLGV